MNLEQFLQIQTNYNVQAAKIRKKLSEENKVS